MHQTSSLRRYSGSNQLFHWITAAVMFVIILLGWVMDSKSPDPAMAPLWEWHKTLGVFVLFITAARIVWRWLDPPPPSPAGQPAWDRHLAGMTYVIFFAILIWMPLTGYLYSTAAGHPPKLFNLIETPALVDKSEAVKEFWKELHLSSQWLLYALIILHVAGVVYHVAIVRDRVLDRMLPEPRDM